MDVFEEFAARYPDFFEVYASGPIIIAVIVVIALYILEMTVFRGMLRERGLAGAQKARALGNVVTARRKEYWTDDPTSSSPAAYYHATYVYEVAGHTYKYYYREHAVPPVELTLYYVKSPKKAFPDKQSSNGGLTFLFLVGPWIAAVLVIILMGGI